jgi:hypothetical protein
MAQNNHVGTSYNIPPPYLIVLLVRGACIPVIIGRLNKNMNYIPKKTKKDKIFSTHDDDK